MQEVYKADWFARNEITKYPLDSSASLLSDSGEASHLDNLITDISVSFPSTLGDQIRISAITVTNELITVVLSTTLDGSDISLLAFSDRLSNVKPCQYYTLSSLKPGCYGVITFGSAVHTVRGQFRFATYAQSGVIPSAQCRYAAFPVLSVSKQGSVTRKIGDVLFKAGQDISITKETIEPQVTRLDGPIGTRQALVFRLESLDLAKTLQDYCLVCSGKPESDTCNMKNIASIAGVTPDCSGNIAINFEGLMALGDEGSLLLSSEKLLSDMCSDKLPYLITGENKCEEEGYVASTSLYSLITPQGDTGLRYAPNGGVTNATEDVATTTLVTPLGDAMQFRFTTKGTFSVSASGVTFMQTGNTVSVSSDTRTIVSDTYSLYLQIGLTEWLLKTESTTLETWPVSLESLTDVTMTLLDCFCLDIDTL